MNVLVVDIGNTRVKWRLAALDDADPSGAPEGSVALAGIHDLVDAWRALAATAVAAAFVSNVAAAENAERIRAAVESVWPIADVRLVVAAGAQCGVVNGYGDATRLGPDRWLSAVAAHRIRPDGAVLVCSFGTATTIDLLLPAGSADRTARFVGGLILPGFDAMRDALASGTARLPRGDGDVVDFGTSTDDAITSGIVAAQLGAVALAIAAAAARSTPTATASVVTCLFAGGGSREAAARAATLPAFSSGVRVQVVPDLVLLGLVAVASDTLEEELRRTAGVAGH